MSTTNKDEIEDLSKDELLDEIAEAANYGERERKLRRELADRKLRGDA